MTIRQITKFKLADLNLKNIADSRSLDGISSDTVPTAPVKENQTQTITTPSRPPQIIVAQTEEALEKQRKELFSRPGENIVLPSASKKLDLVAEESKPSSSVSEPIAPVEPAIKASENSSNQQSDKQVKVLDGYQKIIWFSKFLRFQPRKKLRKQWLEECEQKFTCFNQIIDEIYTAGSVSGTSPLNQNQSNGKQASQDNVGFDLHVQDYQINAAYNHPWNYFHEMSNAQLEQVITKLQQLDEILAKEKAFIEKQEKPNFLARILPFLAKLLHGEACAFARLHAATIKEKEYEIMRAKQGLAQACFDRCVKYGIDADLPAEQFEKFNKFIQENGNFSTLSIPKNKANDGVKSLLKFIAEQYKENERKNKQYRVPFNRFMMYVYKENKELAWYKRILLKPTEEYYLQKQYLQGMEAQVVAGKYNISSFLIGDQEQFAWLIHNYNKEKKKNININNFDSELTELKKFIEAEKEKLTQEIKESSWLQKFSRQIKEKKAQLDYLTQVLQPHDLQEDEYVKIVIDFPKEEKEASSVKLDERTELFIKKYNESRKETNKSLLLPGGLMQLANRRDGNNDYYLANVYKEYNKMHSSSPIDVCINRNSLTEQQRTYVIDWLREHQPEFANFINCYEKNSLKDESGNFAAENTDNRGDYARYFTRYLKTLAAELKEPFCGLKSKYHRRGKDAVNCLNDLLAYGGMYEATNNKGENLNNGVDRSAIQDINSYINLISFSIQNKVIPISEIEIEVKDKSSEVRQRFLKECETANYLRALELLKQIVNGDYPDLSVTSEGCDKTDDELLETYMLSKTGLRDVAKVSVVSYLVGKYTLYYLKKEFLAPSYTGPSGEKNWVPIYRNYIAKYASALFVQEKFAKHSLDAYKYFHSLFIPSELAVAANIQRSEIIKQHCKVTLHTDWENAKIAAIDLYINGGMTKEGVKIIPYDGRDTKYAEVITLTGTEEQRKEYGRRLLQQIFTKSAIQLTKEQEAFIAENHSILLNDVIDHIVDDYIRNPKFMWTPETHVIIDKYGTTRNKHRYVEKRLGELLDKNAEDEFLKKKTSRKQVIQYVKEIAAYQINGSFYPDEQGSQELANVISQHLKKNRGKNPSGWNLTADLIAAEFLKQQPECLQKIRLNKLKHLLNDQLDYVGNDAANVDKDKLEETTQFIFRSREISKAQVKGVLVEETENTASVRAAGRKDLNELFAAYLSRQPVRWALYAEEIFTEFDEEDTYLQRLRLVAVEEFLTLNNYRDSLEYVHYLKASNKPWVIKKENDLKNGQSQQSFYLLIKNDIQMHGWRDNTELFARTSEDTQSLDLCRIARLKYLIAQKNVILTERHLLMLLEQEGGIKGQLVAGNESQEKVCQLLRNAMQEQKIWNPNLELLIEYFEPEQQKNALLHQYRRQRLAEIRSGSGMSYGHFDIQENDKVTEKQRRLFERKERQRYENLRGNVSKDFAHVAKIQEYFGNDIDWLKKEALSYVMQKNISYKNEYEIYELFLMLISEIVGDTVINSSKETLFQYWSKIVVRRNKDKEVYANIEQIKAALIQGEVEKGIAIYQRVQMDLNTHQTREGENSVSLLEDEKCLKETIQGVNKSIVEIIIDIVASRTPVKNFQQEITMQASKILVSGKFNIDTMQAFTNFVENRGHLIPANASHEFKEKISQLIGLESNLRIYSSKILGSHHLNQFVELTEFIRQIPSSDSEFYQLYIHSMQDYVENKNLSASARRHQRGANVAHKNLINSVRTMVECWLNILANKKLARLKEALKNAQFANNMMDDELVSLSAKSKYSEVITALEKMLDKLSPVFQESQAAELKVVCRALNDNALKELKTILVGMKNENNQENNAIKICKILEILYFYHYTSLNKDYQEKFAKLSTVEEIRASLAKIGNEHTYQRLSNAVKEIETHDESFYINKKLARLNTEFVQKYCPNDTQIQVNEIIRHAEKIDAVFQHVNHEVAYLTEKDLAKRKPIFCIDPNGLKYIHMGIDRDKKIEIVTKLSSLLTLKSDLSCRVAALINALTHPSDSNNSLLNETYLHAKNYNDFNAIIDKLKDNHVVESNFFTIDFLSLKNFISQDQLYQDHVIKQLDTAVENNPIAKSFCLAMKAFVMQQREDHSEVEINFNRYANYHVILEKIESFIKNPQEGNYAAVISQEVDLLLQSSVEMQEAIRAKLSEFLMQETAYDFAGYLIQKIGNGTLYEEAVQNGVYYLENALSSLAATTPRTMQLLEKENFENRAQEFAGKLQRLRSARNDNLNCFLKSIQDAAAKNPAILKSVDLTIIPESDIYEKMLVKLGKLIYDLKKDHSFYSYAQLCKQLDEFSSKTTRVAAVSILMQECQTIDAKKYADLLRIFTLAKKHLERKESKTVESSENKEVSAAYQSIMLQVNNSFSKKINEKEIREAFKIIESKGSLKQCASLENYIQAYILHMDITPCMNPYLFDNVKQVKKIFAPLISSSDKEKLDSFIQKQQAASAVSASKEKSPKIASNRYVLRGVIGLDADNRTPQAPQDSTTSPFVNYK